MGQGQRWQGPEVVGRPRSIGRAVGRARGRSVGRAGGRSRGRLVGRAVGRSGWSGERVHAFFISSYVSFPQKDNAPISTIAYSCNPVASTQFWVRNQELLRTEEIIKSIGLSAPVAAVCHPLARCCVMVPPCARSWVLPPTPCSRRGWGWGWVSPSTTCYAAGSRRAAQSVDALAVVVQDIAFNGMVQDWSR